jgi:hypothetical protein
LTIQRPLDLEDGASRACAAVEAAARVAAFVHDRDDCLHALRLQGPRVFVEHVRLGEKAHRRDAAWHDDAGRRARHHADEADPHAVERLDEGGREDRLVRRAVDHIRGEEGKARARKGGPLAALPRRAARRLAAALRQSPKLVGALVELVVADDAEVDADRVHHFDGGLVVEKARNQRRGADEVSA